MYRVNNLGQRKIDIDFAGKASYKLSNKKIFLGFISFVHKVIPMQQCCFC